MPNATVEEIVTKSHAHNLLSRIQDSRRRKDVKKNCETHVQRYILTEKCKGQNDYGKL